MATFDRHWFRRPRTMLFLKMLRQSSISWSGYSFSFLVGVAVDKIIGATCSLSSLWTKDAILRFISHTLLSWAFQWKRTDGRKELFPTCKLINNIYVFHRCSNVYFEFINWWLLRFVTHFRRGCKRSSLAYVNYKGSAKWTTNAVFGFIFQFFLP